MSAITQLERLGYTFSLNADGQTIHYERLVDVDSDKARALLAELKAEKQQAIQLLRARSLPDQITFEEWPALREKYGLQVIGVDYDGYSNPRLIVKARFIDTKNGSV